MFSRVAEVVSGDECSYHWSIDDRSSLRVASVLQTPLSRVSPLRRHRAAGFSDRFHAVFSISLVFVWALLSERPEVKKNPR